MDTGDTNSLPVALIDAQDETYVLPIREYLETHGVVVFINHELEHPPLYHFVAGDATFVKQFFSRWQRYHVKQLGIVLGGGRKPEEFEASIKIIQADVSPLTSSDILELFNFFFTEGKSRLDIRHHEETRTVHEPQKADDARISSLIRDVFKEDATAQTRAMHTKKLRHKKRLRAWILGMLIGVAIFVLPTLWYVSSIILGGVAIVSGEKALRDGNVRLVEWDMHIADYWVHQGSFILDFVSVPLSWVGWEDSVRGQQRLLSFFDDTIKAQIQITTLSGVAQRVASGLLNQVNEGSTGTTAASDIAQLRVSLYTLNTTLGLAQAELSQLLTEGAFPFDVAIVRQKGNEAVASLADIRQSSGDIDKLLSLFVSMAGFREPRTYLVLFQNSMELRPTGGFIGSLGLASFDTGRMTNLDIQDVYTFDGQLKGHVDPPGPIKDLLGQEHWYLRDSNWDPDFKEAATRASWFYEKESGSAVNGVIAINTPLITSLLEATGPIELPDYHDRITAENFYGKSLYYTQNEFFPGSTQKKDFLGSLARVLLDTITAKERTNTTKLFRAVTIALKSHDLMMMMTDPQLQTLIDHYGWAGRSPSGEGCQGTEINTCLTDPFMSVESNMGVNKVNYFVTRTLKREIAVRADGSREEHATLTVHNGAGGTNNLPYRSYIRFLLPLDSSLVSVTSGGVPVPARKGGKVPPLPYVETTPLASGQSVVGVALDVPPGTDKNLVLFYTMLQPLGFGPGGGALDIVMQKQPGVTDENVNTVVSYPAGWTAAIENNQESPAPTDFIAKPGQLTYNMVLTRDYITRIRFTKP